MSSWRVDQDPPADFLRLLYDEEGEGEENFSDVESDDEVDVNEGHRTPTPEAPQYSPLTSPSHREDRERSRSPIRDSEPTGVVVRIYDEAGVALDEEFLTPDAHPIYNFDSVNVVNDASERRNRRRGMRGIRGRGREHAGVHFRIDVGGEGFSGRWDTH
ncbi:hypothetical protein evm_009941 [Chilo suppressalis]|nr:hypothetical protein evm_009941 [Chilo suppressalis]